MKKYVKPEFKCRKSNFELCAIEVHSTVADEQLTNEVIFDRDEKDPIF